MNAISSWADPTQGMLPLCGELSITAPQPQSANARNAPRVAVALGAGVRQRGAAAVSVQILDLSTHGFRIETHLSLDVGSPIWLRLPGLEASLARVMWREGNFFGCAFDRPLHSAVVDLIVSRAGSR